MTEKNKKIKKSPVGLEDRNTPYERELFKCRSCGEKYENAFCSTGDVGICRWCSGEEE